jgi:pimeloyl-ACP methyl ester carboxylesterase
LDWPGSKKPTKKATTPLSPTLSFIDLHPLGRQSLPTILFIHGAGGSHKSWRRQHPLSNHFRLILLDLPGHGDSRGPAEAAVGNYADTVIDFIQANRLTRVILCGHSMGGAVALEIALREPASLNGLALVDTGAKLRVLPAIFALIRDDFTVAVQAMSGFVLSPSAPAELVEEEKQLLAQNSPDLLLKDFTACDSFDIMDRVDEIKLPTLVICGKDDRLTNPKYSELLHERIAGSEIVLMDECGHMPMLEQSERFNDHLFRFARQLQEGK